MGAYIIKCDEVVKDSDGNIKELRCTCDFESGCNPPSDGRKVKGTIHWLSADYAENTEIRVYGRMFTLENVFDIPEDSSYMDYFNPDSLEIYKNAKVEPSLKSAVPGDKFQFVRTGYFCKDTKYDNVFNMTVNLKGSYKPE